MFKGNLYGKAERMEKIYSRIVRIVSIIIIGYLFLQGLFTICNMQRVTEQVYYMKNNPWRQGSGSLVIRKRFICVLELFSEEIPLPGNPEAMLTCGRTRTV